VTRRLPVGMGAAVFILIPSFMLAQTPAAGTGVQREIVQRGDVSVSGREAVTIRITISS